MRNNILFFFFLFFTGFCLIPNTTLAHKVRVFAYGEGDTIVGETAFSGGRKPKNADIFVQDAASGKQVYTSQTDEKGDFRFDIPQEAREGKMDLMIIVKAGDGHSGEWPLAASDYLTGVEETASVAATDSVPEEGTETAVPAQAAPQTGVSLQQLEEVIGKVIDRKLTPVKHMLAQSSEHGPSLQDILGGIGYILGLAGIAAYFKAQQKNKGNKG